MPSSQPTILIIIGISGDLARRYLLKAIGELAHAQVLPESFYLLGTTRQNNLSVDTIIGQLPASDYLSAHTEIIQLNTADPADYKKLKEKINEIEQLTGPSQQLFYLSVPPQVTSEIINHLGQQGFNRTNTKLLLEKPFGSDLISAQKQINSIDEYFSPEQVYRIDHYLAKETVQNIIVFRQCNTLFRQTWNNNFISGIEIIANEQIDIEGRTNFYEQTGALRDIAQNHLLQLAALTIMELPNHPSETPLKRFQALKSLSMATPLANSVIRAQYKSYRTEVQNPDSTTETFVSLKLASSDPAWNNVPITLVTGKALNKKSTEICITYRCDDGSSPDKLVLHLQPNEGIEIDLWAKMPGYGNEIAKHTLTFSYQEHYQKLPGAYEHIILDAINSQHDLFASSEEIIESWRILDPVQQFWQSQIKDLRFYLKGSQRQDI